MSDNQKHLLYLIRVGIIHEKINQTIISAIDWSALLHEATKQGVAGLVWDAIQSNTVIYGNMPLDNKMEWFGCVRLLEEEYKRHDTFISEHSVFLGKHGIRMMVLKGWSLSKIWPKPEHRPTGDVDIYEFGDWKKADELVSKHYGVNIDRSHHHHTTYYLNNVFVENHYDFINQYVKTSSKELETEYKRLAADEKPNIAHTLKGIEILMPSANLHALFMIRHHSYHFTSTELTLRMLLDWYFFRNAYKDDIDWGYIHDWCDKVGMTKFLVYMDEMCQHIVDGRHVFQDRFGELMLDEIFNPKYNGREKAKGIFRYLVLWRRWWNNRWKNKVVYKESLASQLCSLIKAHMINPTLELSKRK